MHGITINMNPIIATIGSLEIQWHGLLSALAVIAAVIIVSFTARKKGISQNFIYTASIWSVVGGVIGARAFHVADSFSLYRPDLWRMFAIQEGGLAIWGGLIGGVVAAVIYVKFFSKERINLAHLVDAAVPCLLVA